MNSQILNVASPTKAASNAYIPFRRLTTQKVGKKHREWPGEAEASKAHQVPGPEQIHTQELQNEPFRNRQLPRCAVRPEPECLAVPKRLRSANQHAVGMVQ